MNNGIDLEKLIYVPKDNAEAEEYAKAMLRQTGHTEEQIADYMSRRIK
jgi:hypothetical protein